MGRKRLPDCTGKQFGKLVVQEQYVDEYKGVRQSLCRCLCDCGNECVVQTYRLTTASGALPSHPTLSCGCQRVNKIDIGARYGRLTVVSRAGKSKSGDRLYLCHCDCGKDKEITAAQLKSGEAISCGCALAEFRKSFGKYGARGAAASKTPEAVEKRVKAMFGEPGSEARHNQQKRLAGELERTHSLEDGINASHLISDNPLGKNPYRGVSYHKTRGFWTAYCRVRGIRWQKGHFHTPEEAKEARDEKLKELIELTGAQETLDKRREYIKKRQECE